MYVNMIRKFLYCYFVSKYVNKIFYSYVVLGKIYIFKFCLRWVYIIVFDWLFKDMMFDKWGIVFYGW